MKFSSEQIFAVGLKQVDFLSFKARQYLFPINMYFKSLRIQLRLIPCPHAIEEENNNLINDHAASEAVAAYWTSALVNKSRALDRKHSHHTNSYGTPIFSVSAGPEFWGVIDDPLLENLGVIGDFRRSELFYV